MDEDEDETTGTRRECVVGNLSLEMHRWECVAGNASLGVRRWECASYHALPKMFISGCSSQDVHPSRRFPERAVRIFRSRRYTENGKSVVPRPKYFYLDKNLSNRYINYIYSQAIVT